MVPSRFYRMTLATLLVWLALATLVYGQCRPVSDKDRQDAGSEIILTKDETGKKFSSGSTVNQPHSFEVLFADTSSDPSHQHFTMTNTNHTADPTKTYMYFYAPKLATTLLPYFYLRNAESCQTDVAKEAVVGVSVYPVKTNPPGLTSTTPRAKPCLAVPVGDTATLGSAIPLTYNNDPTKMAWKGNDPNIPYNFEVDAQKGKNDKGVEQLLFTIKNVESKKADHPWPFHYLVHLKTSKVPSYYLTGVDSCQFGTAIEDVIGVDVFAVLSDTDSWPDCLQVPEGDNTALTDTVKLASTDGQKTIWSGNGPTGVPFSFAANVKATKSDKGDEQLTFMVKNTNSDSSVLGKQDWIFQYHVILKSNPVPSYYLAKTDFCKFTTPKDDIAEIQVSRQGTGGGTTNPQEAKDCIPVPAGDTTKLDTGITLKYNNDYHNMKWTADKTDKVPFTFTTEAQKTKANGKDQLKFTISNAYTTPPDRKWEFHYQVKLKSTPASVYYLNLGDSCKFFTDSDEVTEVTVFPELYNGGTPDAKPPKECRPVTSTDAAKEGADIILGYKAENNEWVGTDATTSMGFSAKVSNTADNKKVQVVITNTNPSAPSSNSAVYHYKTKLETTTVPAYYLMGVDTCFFEVALERVTEVVVAMQLDGNIGGTGKKPSACTQTPQEKLYQQSSPIKLTYDNGASAWKSEDAGDIPFTFLATVKVVNDKSGDKNGYTFTSTNTSVIEKGKESTFHFVATIDQEDGTSYSITNAGSCYIEDVVGDVSAISVFPETGSVGRNGGDPPFCEKVSKDDLSKQGQPITLNSNNNITNPVWMGNAPSGMPFTFLVTETEVKGSNGGKQEKFLFTNKATKRLDKDYVFHYLVDLDKTDVPAYYVRNTDPCQVLVDPDTVKGITVAPGGSKSGSNGSGNTGGLKDCTLVSKSDLTMGSEVTLDYDSSKKQYYADGKGINVPFTLAAVVSDDTSTDQKFTLTNTKQSTSSTQSSVIIQYHFDLGTKADPISYSLEDASSCNAVVTIASDGQLNKVTASQQDSKTSTTGSLSRCDEVKSEDLQKEGNEITLNGDGGSTTWIGSATIDSTAYSLSLKVTTDNSQGGSGKLRMTLDYDGSPDPSTMPTFHYKVTLESSQEPKYYYVKNEKGCTVSLSSATDKVSSVSVFPETNPGSTSPGGKKGGKCSEATQKELNSKNDNYKIDLVEGTQSNKWTADGKIGSDSFTFTLQNADDSSNPTSKQLTLTLHNDNQSVLTSTGTLTALYEIQAGGMTLPTYAVYDSDSCQASTDMDLVTGVSVYPLAPQKGNNPSSSVDSCDEVSDVDLKNEGNAITLTYNNAQNEWGSGEVKGIPFTFTAVTADTTGKDGAKQISLTFKNKNASVLSEKWIFHYHVELVGARMPAYYVRDSDACVATANRDFVSAITVYQQTVGSNNGGAGSNGGDKCKPVTWKDQADLANEIKLAYNKTADDWFSSDYPNVPFSFTVKLTKLTGSRPSQSELPQMRFDLSNKRDDTNPSDPWEFQYVLQASDESYFLFKLDGEASCSAIVDYADISNVYVYPTYNNQ